MSNADHSLFQVGEVALGQGYNLDTEYNGMECTILTPLRYVKDVPALSIPNRLRSGWWYEVMWANGLDSNAHPWNLRKREQPADPIECDVDKAVEA